MTSSIMDYVDMYRDMGICIIPIPKGHKGPVIPWKQYQTRQPTDEEINKWFSNGDVNIGIVCGKISKLTVFDFDRLSSYTRAFKHRNELEDNTLVVESSATHRHVYIRTDEKVDSRKWMDLAFEVHGEGTLIVAPPSLHPAGHNYRFVKNHQKIVSIDNMNSAITDICDKLKINVPKGMTPCQEYVLTQGVDEGERDESAIRLGSYLKKKRFNNENITSLLLQWNERNRPSLPSDDIYRKVKSAQREYNYSCDKLKTLASYRRGCNPSMCDRNKGKKKSIKDLELPDPDVTIHPGEQNYYYKFAFNGNVYKAQDTELFSSSGFECWYLRQFREIIHIKKEDWTDTVNEWLAEAEIKPYEEISTDKLIEEEIITHIQKSVVVENIKETLTDINRVFIDGDIVYIPTITIKGIIERSGYGSVSPRKLSVILDSYTSKSTCPKTIDGKSYRFWAFGTDKLKMKNRKVFRFGDEKDDNDD